MAKKYAPLHSLLMHANLPNNCISNSNHRARVQVATLTSRHPHSALQQPASPGNDSTSSNVHKEIHGKTQPLLTY